MTVVKLLQAHPAGTGPLALGEAFLDKYEVRGLLGRGGHAWVYECFDRFLQRTVALKVIKTLREAGRDLSRRGRSEAQVLAAMTHPNLVHVLDAGTVGGLVYIVMEKLEGRTLREALLSVSRLSIRDALNIAIQVADGLQLAHEHGVIHRDLKPENIFLEAGDRVKVLDFGVAKVLGASHVTTQRDRLQGTVFYMSPEQLQGVAVTPASDVFALGTMLFEMLYGHPLMLGGGELPSNEHVAWMQLYQVPPPLETLDRSIPRYVGKLVGRAIVKLPAERIQSMRELKDAARSALRRYDAERTGLDDRAGEAESSKASALELDPAALLEPFTAPRDPAESKREAVASKSLTRTVPRPLLLGFLAGAIAIALVLSRHSAPPARALAPARSETRRPRSSHAVPPAATIAQVAPRIPQLPDHLVQPGLPPGPQAPLSRLLSDAAPTALMRVPTPPPLQLRKVRRRVADVSSGLATPQKSDSQASAAASKANSNRAPETIF